MHMRTVHFILLSLLAHGLILAIPAAQVPKEDPTLSEVRLSFVKNAAPTSRPIRIPPLSSLKDSRRAQPTMQAQARIEPLVPTSARISFAPLAPLQKRFAPGESRSSGHAASIDQIRVARDVEADDSGIVTAQMGTKDGPAFEEMVPPRYPSRAKRLRREGSVLLELSLDKQGKLMDVKVVKGAGYGFDEEALRSVRKSRFRPAMRKGKPVACRALLPIRFELKE